MLENKLESFLDVNSYLKTFEINLNKDEIAREFWIKQLPLLISKFASKALESENNCESAVERVDKYKQEYSQKVDELMTNNNDFVSVRILLELNEVFLKKNGFEDVWRGQKSNENTEAIKLLSKRLKEIDSLSDRSRWQEIVKGVLAGNIFDSGATAVQDLLQNNVNFGLEEALQQIPERPWLIDSFEEFVIRVTQGPFHKCAIIFCDNSGVDCVLGILPLAREFLKNKTKVILSANSEPALNDVTNDELVSVVERAATTCAIINESYQNKNLMLSASGQKGCCLNFLTINEKLIDKMIENNVDLIVIEGMGRSLHTNLNSKFRCDSLKLAVIKNKFLASRLGGTLFDSICKFETGC